jgi:serine/threonine-protein kinase
MVRARRWEAVASIVVGALAGCGADATAGSDADGLAADAEAETTGGGDTAAQGDTPTQVDAAADSQGEAASGSDATADVPNEVVSDSQQETSVTPDDGWFEQVMPWVVSVRDAAPHARSEAMIAALAGRGGWGNGDLFQIDFSLVVLEAGADTPRRTFVPNGDFYEGDCDHVPVPVPAGGALEGEDGYACESDGDCHLIVRQGDELFEMWRANIDASGAFDGGCLAVWELARSYPESLRGEGCTSADAAGLPIAPLVFSVEEVVAGHIGHAIRFILPNSRIAHRQYVRPATHATGAASADVDGMPYGVRLRLRADYPLAELPSEGARVVARALQEYGMLLADGGQIALTAASDRGSAARWDELLGPRDLAALAVGDFEVVDMGAIHDWDGDCYRNP